MQPFLISKLIIFAHRLVNFVWEMRNLTRQNRKNDVQPSRVEFGHVVPYL
jgi:hypothetical protein